MHSAQPSTGRVALAGSERTLPKQATDKGSVDPDQQVQVTIRLRSRTPDTDMKSIMQHAAAQPIGSRQYLSREQLDELRGATSGDVAWVEQFAAAHHLRVIQVDQAARTISLKGRLKKLQQAFGVDLRKYEGGGHIFRARSGSIRCRATSLRPFWECWAWIRAPPPRLVQCKISVCLALYLFDLRAAKRSWNEWHYEI